jgi:hypothetical protein
MMEQSHFYRNLVPFEDFGEVTDAQHFERVPDDWYLVVTDIQNSTRAIRNNKYREVNLIGASAIALAEDVIGTLEFPFSFGGDGATLVLPPDELRELRPRLCGLRALAERRFDLDLRVGAVPVEVVNGSGVKLEVARYQVTPGVTIGIFRGGGTGAAERLVKEGPETYRLSAEDPPAVHLDGLSCRWKPIPSQNDVMLSILVSARSTPEQRVYRKVIDRIRTIFDGDLRKGNPVNNEGLRYRTVQECYDDEKRYTSQWSLGYLLRLLEIVLAVAIFRWHIPIPFVDAQHYRQALPDHSDYRKFDDMLQLTLDCSERQRRQIEEYLDGLHREGEIFFGCHASPEALMTCFVEQLEDGGHIHFIDGGQGGYSMAAVQLKRQVRQSEHDPEAETFTGDPTSPSER